MNKTENNRATVRAYVEVFNAGAFDRIRTLFTPDARIHGVIGSATLSSVMFNTLNRLLLAIWS